MLFHSPEFILFFIPLVWAVYVLTLGRSARISTWWLIGASLFFYAMLDGEKVVLLIGILLGNYFFSRVLAGAPPSLRKGLLVCGITANLGYLLYFKYAGLLTAHLSLGAIVTPIGISFITLQQIIYLVQIARGQIPVPAFGDFLLFGTFFPYIVAGPIVQASEIFPQLTARDRRTVFELAVPGIILFSFGLFKKVVIADNLIDIVKDVFDTNRFGFPLGALDAWAGVLAYVLRLYFDFSGYSDMALGIGALFGIRLPINFYSPYKATNIADFWRRWHMSMTRFFAVYVYLPLAVSLTRRSMKSGHGTIGRFMAARGIPLVVTFFLSGIWHGAKQNFAVFPLLMGIALIVTNAWQSLRLPPPPSALGWALTMLVVTAGVVIDRTGTLGDAGHMFLAMVNGRAGELVSADGMVRILACGLIAVAMPNTHEIMAAWPLSIDTGGHDTSRFNERMRWLRGEAGALVAGVAAVISFLLMTKASDFIYYRF
ncbi:MAG TPA: MBOAT family O-acyltransferase [Dongiaceae bacterium]|jgi:D-alanyl-lipoteichoic acid acyltransferase DltB (MBOAT superfamily)|nr:MBOAT family O-acyltransferase [Dongiaceae bacterium]